MVWFWIGGGLAAAGLTAWARWLAKRPWAPRWWRRLTAVPFIIWVLSVGVAAYFTWRAFHVVEAAAASEKAALMALSIAWGMNATLIGIVGLGVVAMVLGFLTMKRR
jgi:hypothetical protein